MAVFLWKMRYRSVLKAIFPQVTLFNQNKRHWKTDPLIFILGKNLYTNHSLECSEKDLKGKCVEIFNAIESKEPNICSEVQFTSLYQYLIDAGVKSSTVEAQLLETPDLLKYPIKQWKSVFDLLMKHGISSDVVFKNITLFPHLLKCSMNMLQRNVEKYSEMHIGQLSFLQIIQRNPELYVYSPKAIGRRMSMLYSMFPPTELRMVIKNNPNILTEDWSSVSEKVMYIHKEMGLEQPHIAASEALRKSLLHIKARHQFLARAGFYSKPNLYRDKTSDRSNHPLSLIMDTSNRYFANKVAKLSEYEYDVFYSMIKEEDELQESGSDSGNDSDSDFNIESLN